MPAGERPKKGARFVAHPRHPLTSKQFRVSGRSPRELEARLHHLDRLREDYRLGEIDEAKLDRALRNIRYGPIKVSRVVESYMRRKDISADTVRKMREVFAGPLVELAPLNFEALEPAVLSPLFERLGARLSKASIRTIWRVLRAIARHAAERGWTSRVPWGAWRPRQGLGRAGRPPRECCRNPAQLELLVDVAQVVDREDLARGKYRALAPKIAAAGYLGLRRGELAGLRRGDVDFGRGRVSIRRQWDGVPLKGALSGAELPAPPRLFALLEQHFDTVDLRSVGGVPVVVVGRAERAVFECAGGGFYARGREVIDLDALRELVKRAGLPHAERWSTHSLRDTFVTLKARELRGDFEAIRAWSRHARIESLVRYLRSFDREVALALLPPADAK